MSIHDPIAVVTPRRNPVLDVPERDSAGRLAWADIAKGWSIILVVLMHSTLGVGDDLNATGWTHSLVAYAKPFRMPDFFLVAGLFAGVAVHQSWRHFLDRRILHFVYFYMLWAPVTIIVKGVGSKSGLSDMGILMLQSLYEPFSSLWFIYVLPILFLIVRLARGVSPALMVLAAAQLHILASYYADGGQYALSSDMTGWFAIDATAMFLVFFLIGYYCQPSLQMLARWSQREPALAMIGLASWALINGVLVATGLAHLPIATLLLGLAGALAVVVASALMAMTPLFSAVAAIGRQSLVVYLAFTIPMAATRLMLIKLGIVCDTGLASVATAAVALGAPLVLAAVVRGTPLSFLFQRPQWARLAG